MTTLGSSQAQLGPYPTSFPTWPTVVLDKSQDKSHFNYTDNITPKIRKANVIFDRSMCLNSHVKSVVCSCLSILGTLLRSNLWFQK